MNTLGLSDAFQATVLGPHAVATRAMLYDRSGLYVADLPVLSGRIEMSATADVGRRCDVTVLDDGTTPLVPQLPTDPLGPFGSELQLWRGAEVNGAVELVQLGRFVFDAIDITDAGEGRAIQVQGYDRSVKVQAARFTDTFVVPYGTSIGGSVGAIRTIIEAGVGAQRYSGDWAVGHSTLAALVYDAQADRWAECQKLAASINHTLRYAADGSLALSAIPDFTNVQPVAYYTDGEGSTTVSLKRTLSARETYSQVIVVGQSTGITSGAPVRGVATDADLQALIGTKPYFYSSEFIYTTQQAQDVAASMLPGVATPFETIEVAAIPDPRIEPDDVVFVSRVDLGVAGQYVVETVSMPLDVETPMTLGLRRRAV